MGGDALLPYLSRKPDGTVGILVETWHNPTINKWLAAPQGWDASYDGPFGTGETAEAAADHFLSAVDEFMDKAIKEKEVDPPSRTPGT